LARRCAAPWPAPWAWLASVPWPPKHPAPPPAPGGGNAVLSSGLLYAGIGVAGVVLILGIALTCRRRGGSTPSTAPRGGTKVVTAQAAAAQKGKQLPNAAKGAGAPAAAPLPIGKGPATVAGALKGGAAAPFKAVIPPAPPGKAAAPAAAPPGKAAATLQGVATAATAATASKGAPPAAKPPPPRPGTGKK
jgi:hypothetical protein